MKLKRWLWFGHFLFFTALLCSLLPAGIAMGQNIDSTNGATVAKDTTEAAKNEVMEKVYKIQVPFIANEGQIENDAVLFYAKTFGGTVYVTRDSQLVYALPKFEDKATDRGGERIKPEATKGWILKEVLVDALSTHPQGVNQQKTKVNYFIGHDKDKWRSDVATYKLVSFGEVYPGIDLTLRANGQNVEKVFTVKPGASVKDIKIRVMGADSLKVNGKGQLEVETGLGTVSFTAPVAYQEKDGKREYVSASYHVVDDTYGFTVGKYDKSSPLIIDPLLASTFIGGSSNENCDITTPMVIDQESNVYIGGFTMSSDYPVDNSYDQSFNGYYDAFISKFDPGLNNLLASTFIGGRRDERILSMGIDGSGNIFISGNTESYDYPVNPGAYNGAGIGNYDIFVSKFDPDLKSLLASTTIGGSLNELQYTADSLTVDKSGNVYIAGYTESSDYPTTAGAFQSYKAGLYVDGFITKFNNDLSDLLASTYVGGTRSDHISSILTDHSGNVYISGCGSTDYPVTPGAYKTSGGGAFISKFDTQLSRLLASTFSDLGEILAIDNNGNIYTLKLEMIIHPDEDPFLSNCTNTNTTYTIMKLNADMTSCEVSNTLPDNYDIAGGRYLKIDKNGNIYMLGGRNLEIGKNGNIRMCIPQNQNGDILIFKLENGVIKESVSIGGSKGDNPSSLVIDKTGNIYVAGTTSSFDFPTTSGAYDQSYNGGYADLFGEGTDIFVLKYSGDLRSKLPVASFTYFADFLLPGEEFEFDASSSYDPDGEIKTYQWDFGDGTGGYGQKISHVYKTDGHYQVSLTVTDNNGDSDTTIHNIWLFKNYSGTSGVPKISTLEETGTLVHDPVDCATGAHVLQRTLLTTTGAQPISFKVRYNSLLLNEGPLGKGWGHNFEANLEELNGGNVKIHWNANRVNTFINLDNNRFISPDLAVRHDKLVKNADGSYTLTRQDQTVYQFDNNGQS